MAYNYPTYGPGYGPAYTPGYGQGYNQGYQPQAYPSVPQPQPQPQQIGQQPSFVCCPVTSREEAVAYRVEAFGPAVVMPDLGHGMIYFKRFNEKTALADFGEFRYVQQEQEVEKPAAPDYSAIVSGFTTRLDTMGEKIDAIFEQLNQKPVSKQTKGAAEK